MRAMGDGGWAIPKKEIAITREAEKHVTSAVLITFSGGRCQSMVTAFSYSHVSLLNSTSQTTASFSYNRSLSLHPRSQRLEDIKMCYDRILENRYSLSFRRAMTYLRFRTLFFFALSKYHIKRVRSTRWAWSALSLVQLHTP